MKLPFLSRARHDAIVAELRGRLELAVFRAVQSDAQVEYWRKRAELFLDRASARVGITHEPVMREGGEPRQTEHEAVNSFAGFGVAVIDSTKPDFKPDADWRKRMHEDQTDTQERAL